MKKWIVLLLALCLLAGGSAAAGEGAPVTTTVMVYMCGSNLESQYGLATVDIFEMMDSGYDSRYTDVVLMLGGSSRWELDAFDSGRSSISQIRGSGLKEIWTGEGMNMGSGETLRMFLDKVYEQYRSDRYVLIFWNHGGGPMGGVCWDENHGGDSLLMTELAEGIRTSRFAGRGLDLIGFDACLMSSVETAWMLAPYAGYMAASEETEPGSGWDYSFLRGIEHRSVEEIGRSIADGYLDSFPADTGHSLTMAVVDLSSVGRVVEGMDAFFSQMCDRLDEKAFQDMSSIRHWAKSYGRDFRAEQSGDYDMVDLGSLLEACGQFDIPSAAALRSALEEAVCYQRSNQAGSSGLSVYFPYYNEAAYEEKGADFHRKLNFCEGYERYISRFQAYMRGDIAVDWTGLQPVVSRTADGFQVTLPLTARQAEDLVSARLVILESREALQDKNAFFSQVYAAPAQSSEAGILAAYHDEQLVFEYRTMEGYERDSGTLEFMALETGEYQVEAMAANFHGVDNLLTASLAEPGVSRSVLLRLAPPDENGELALKYVLAYDEVTGAYTSRSAELLENYKYLHFLHFSRVPTWENGLMTAFGAWETGWEDAAGMYRQSISADENEMGRRGSFNMVRGTGRTPRYAAFEITDSRNNVFLTGLTPVRPLEEVTLYSRHAELDQPALWVDTSFVASSPLEVLAMISVTNQADAVLSLTLENVRINGVVVPVEELVAGVSTGALGRGDRAGLSISLPITVPLLKADTTALIKELQFDLSVQDAATGRYLGVIENVSCRPGIDYDALYTTFR